MEKRLEAPPGFEPGIEVLQTSALPLGDGADQTVARDPSRPRPRAGREKVERETGFEPATSTLARSHSTTELFPLAAKIQRTTAIFAGSRKPAAASTRARRLRIFRPSGASLVMTRLTPLFCLVMLLAAVPARADQIILQNGDRITGTLVSLANGPVTFQSNDAS